MTCPWPTESLLASETLAESQRVKNKKKDSQTRGQDKDTGGSLRWLQGWAACVSGKRPPISSASGRRPRLLFLSRFNRHRRIKAIPRPPPAKGRSLILPHRRVWPRRVRSDTRFFLCREPPVRGISSPQAVPPQGTRDEGGERR